VEPLATLADLKAHWSGLPADKEDDAEQKLMEASVIIRELYPVDARIKAGTLNPDTVRLVVCQMVKAALDVDETEMPADVSQASFTTGPFTQNLSFRSRDGNLFLTKLQRQLLTGGGARSRKAFTITPGR
jgi:hypothetical protein